MNPLFLLYRPGLFAHRVRCTTPALLSPVELVCITPAGALTYRPGPCRLCVLCTPLRITGRWPGMLRGGGLCIDKCHYVCLVHIFVTYFVEDLHIFLT